MAKTIRIKAAKNAPEIIAHGNLQAELKGGYFETEHERFAEFIQANYGEPEPQGDEEQTEETATKTKSGGRK